MSRELREVGRTAEGVWSRDTEQIALMPLSSGLSLLDDFGRRVLDPACQVTNSIARAVTGVNAHVQHQLLAGQIVGTLRLATPVQRMVFLLVVADYLDRHPNAAGIEPVLGAAINAVWFSVPPGVATTLTNQFQTVVRRSKFARQCGVTLYDPHSNSVSWLSAEALVAADLARSLDDPWRQKLARAGKAQIRKPPMSIGDIVDAINGIGDMPKDPHGPDDQLPGGVSLGTVDVDKWRSRLERQLHLTGDWESGPSVDAYADAARKDLGGGKGGAFADVPGVGSGPMSAEEQADAYLNGDSRNRGPLTKADVDPQHHVALEPDTEKMVGGVLFAAGVGLAITGAKGGSFLVVGVGVVVAVGGAMIYDHGVKNTPPPVPPPEPAPKTPNPLDDTTGRPVNAVVVKKWLKGYDKITPGGLFGKTSDGKEMWRPIDDLADLTMYGTVLVKPVDPLGGEPGDRLVAEERPTDVDPDEDLAAKFKVMVLERRVYRLPTGLGPALHTIDTGEGLVVS